MERIVRRYLRRGTACMFLLSCAPVFADQAPAWAYDELLAPWYAAFNEQDAESLAKLYTPDAKVGDAKGRAQIIKNFESQWANVNITCSGNYDGFRIVGPIATGWGRDTCTVTPKSGGESRATQSKWIVSYERQPDGTWLCSRDFGQEVKYMAGFLPAAGNWEVKEKHRRGPDDSPVGATSEWGIKFIPGNHFVDTSGSRTFENGDVVTWIEVWGVNPSTNASFEQFVDSTGALGNGTFEWIGNTWTSTVDVVDADGSQMTAECALSYSDDYSTFDGQCRVFSNGETWVAYTGKGRKVE